MNEFTIVIPTADRPRLLREAVISAITASQGIGQVLVVDDGMTYNASDALDNLGAKNVNVIRNSRHKGPAGARNTGVEHARGDIIFFLDDDDLLLSDYCVRILSSALHHASEPKFGFSAAINGRSPMKEGKTGPIDRSLSFTSILPGFGMGTWILKKEFLAAGGIREDMAINEDTEFFLRIYSNNINAWYEAQAGVHLRPKNYSPTEMKSTTRLSSAQSRAAAFESILKIHSAILRSDPKYQSKLVHRVIKYRVRLRQRVYAISFALSNGGVMHFLHALLRPAHT